MNYLTLIISNSKDFKYLPHSNDFYSSEFLNIKKMFVA
jgi:hypothetical protein